MLLRLGVLQSLRQFEQVGMPLMPYPHDCVTIWQSDRVKWHVASMPCKRYSTSFHVAPQNPHLQYRVRPCVLTTRENDLPLFSSSAARRTGHAVQSFGTNVVTRGLGFSTLSETIDPPAGSFLWGPMTLPWWLWRLLWCCLLIWGFRSCSN